MSTTHDRGDAMSRLYRTRWFMPAFSLFLGAVGGVAYIASVAFLRWRS